MKKVLMLADANNPHVIKWVNGLLSKGFSVSLFSLTRCNHDNFAVNAIFNIVCFDFDINTNRKNEGNISKLKYLKVLAHLRRYINEVKPDILHSHYASSYGLLGALSGFHPYVISVWGDDVFEFPRKSILHKSLLKFNLLKSDCILSTSNVMLKETKKYTSKNILVTPFGIDLDFFKPLVVDSVFDKHDIVIGTVKTLEDKYGVEYLIRAFKILTDRNPTSPLKLLIVGVGSQEEYLKKLVSELGLNNHAIFTGRVDYSKVPYYQNMLDVSVSVSTSDGESFGVAVIEASACEVPVVVSNVGGLPEVVVNNETGFVVNPRSAEQTANAIEKLIQNIDLRIEFGRNGRDRVRRLYNWVENLDLMVEIYDKVINK